MIDFGLVDGVDAEAIGEPGERTFRLRARVGENRVALWMEKEQLAALGRAISSLLAERAPERRREQPRPAALGAFGEYPDVELQVVRMGLDYDAEGSQLVLLADDAEALERGNTPAFRMEIAHAHAAAVARQISEVVAAGRPLCPLCASPLEEGASHFCPGSNGHSLDLPIPSQGDPDQ